MSFLNKTKLSDFDWLINECSNYVQIDKPIAIDSVKGYIDLLKNGKPVSNTNAIKKLENRWYQSLTSKPDYAVYSHPMYICDVWICWSFYSNKSIKAIINPKSLMNRSVANYLGSCKKVLDLGCGFGFTTACLKEIFPQANVYGTNIKDSWQYNICEKISKQYGFNVLEDSKPIGNVDLIFASEYFEHIENSLEHLHEVITNHRPRMLVVANGYNGTAIGHFNYYKYKNKKYTAKQTSLDFGKMMRHLGYQKLKTKIWNNRPAIWVKV